MSCSLRLACIALCVATAGLTFPGRSGCAEPPQPDKAAPGAGAVVKERAKKPKSPRREAEEAIRRALAQPVSIDFEETPLEDVAAFLQESRRIPVLLDFRALEDVGIRPDAPVSLRVSDISLRSALRLMLRQLDLTCVVRNEVLMISTPEEAEQWDVARVYPVGDLVGRTISTGEIGYDFDSLSNLITTCIRPSTWPDGNHYMPEVDFGSVGAVVFTQTDEAHAEVASLLAALRSIARQTAEGKTPDPILFDRYWPEPPAYELIRKALSRKVSLDLNKAPIDDVIDHLRKITGINIVLDRGALEDVNVPEDALVSIEAADVPLRSALGLILGELDLSYQIWDEVLLITTPEEAEMRLTIGIYPIEEMVGCRDNPRWRGYGGDLLEELIIHCVEPKTWDKVGGVGSLCDADFEHINALVITQTRDMHQKVAEFLTGLRSIARQTAEDEDVDPIEPLKQAFNKIPLHEPAPSALSKKVSFDFTETPLGEVAKFITETCGIECRLDRRPLNAARLSANTSVSLRVSGVTLRSALALMLEELDLTWVVQDKVLLITTLGERESRLTLEIYPVSDMVTFRDQDGKLWEDYGSLTQVITRELSGAWDQSGGGAGWIAGGTFGGAKILIVWQTDRVHEEIAELLEELRELASQASDNGRPPRRNSYYGGWGGGFF